MATLNSNFVDIDDEIYQAICEVAERVNKFHDSCQFDAEPERIENEHVSGFIPYTQGGWEAVITANLAHADSSGSYPKCIQPYINEEFDDCAKQFCEDNNIDIDVFDGNHPEYEDFLPVLGDYLFEGGHYFYKIRAIYYVEPEPKVVFFSAVNTDFEYGRDYISWATNPQCNVNELRFEHTVEELFNNKDLIKQSFQHLLENLENA